MINIFGLLNGLMNNPMQMLNQMGLNVPQNIPQNPQDIIQHLLNTGQISQAQVNNAMQMRNNPMFKGFFNRR